MCLKVIKKCNPKQFLTFRYLKSNEVVCELQYIQKSFSSKTSYPKIKHKKSCKSYINVGLNNVHISKNVRSDKNIPVFMDKKVVW